MRFAYSKKKQITFWFGVVKVNSILLEKNNAKIDD